MISLQKVFAAMTVGAVLAATGIGAGDANADSTDRLICSVLDEYPTGDGVLGVGLGLMDQGYSAYDAGRKIAAAVYGTCPEHADAVDEFMAANTGRTLA